MVYYVITKLRMYSIKIIYGRKVTYMDKYATSNMFDTFCGVIPVNCMHGCYHRKPECLVYWEMEMLSLGTTAKVTNSVTHDLISQISVICDQHRRSQARAYPGSCPGITHYCPSISKLSGFLGITKSSTYIKYPCFIILNLQ